MFPMTRMHQALAISLGLALCAAAGCQPASEPPGDGTSTPENPAAALTADVEWPSYASTAASTPWDMHERGLDSVLRASVHYYNDTDDLHALIEALCDPCL